MAARRIAIAEAALRAHMSRERVLRLLTSGAIEGELAGGFYQICPLSLEKYLASRSNEKRTAATAGAR